ncbi:50S ribosomal protein L15 [bacterium]|nr:50S ribosomal protein L15 [bacterium]
MEEKIFGLHNLKAIKTKKKKRLGRGNSSGSGNYSGKGLKGQKARSGVSSLKRIGMKANITKIPKIKGFKSFKIKPISFNISIIQNNFKDGDIVNVESLKNIGILGKKDDKFKILSDGDINIKVTVSGGLVSAKAKEKIEKAGGIIKE